MVAHKYNPILQMEKLRPREVTTGQHSKTIDENWSGGVVGESVGALFPQAWL